MISWTLDDGKAAPEGTPAEQIPSVAGKISAIASANAPVLYFEDTPFCGLREGIAMISLVADRQIGTGPNETVVRDVVVVASLRSSIPALHRLRSAIDAVLVMAERAQAKSPNTSDALPSDAPMVN